MPEIEVIEVINLIMMSIAVFIFALVGTKRKGLLKYLPGFLSIWWTFLCTNVEAIILPDAFNFMEHLFILLTAIFLSAGVFVDFYSAVLKPKAAEGSATPQMPQYQMNMKGGIRD